MRLTVETFYGINELMSNAEGKLRYLIMNTIQLFYFPYAFYWFERKKVVFVIRCMSKFLLFSKA